MPGFLADLGALASQNQPLAYFIIYVGTIFFGNIAAFVSFWLVLGGAFGLWGAPLLLMTIFAAILSGDLLWYGLGRGLHGTRFGNFIRNRFAPQHEKIEAALMKNGRSWIFVSKFFYASAMPVIFTVGWVGISLKKFFRTSVFSTTIWLPIVTGLSWGLFASLTPLEAVTIIKEFGVGFVAGIVLFLLIYYHIGKFLKKLFVKIFKNGLNGLNGVMNGAVKREDLAPGFEEVETIQDRSQTN